MSKHAQVSACKTTKTESQSQDRGRTERERTGVLARRATDGRFVLDRARAYLSEVSRVELVEKDAVVVLATGVTTPTGMFPVLPDTPVASRDVPPLLAVLRETRRLSVR